MALPLALKGLNLAAANVPDKVFEAIPGGYFKAKEDQEEKDRKDRKRKSRRRSDKRRSSPSPPATDPDESDRGYSSGQYERARGASPRAQERPRGAPSEAYEQSRGPPSEAYQQSRGPASEVEEKYVPYQQYYSESSRSKANNMTYPNGHRDSYGQPRPYNPQDYEPVSSSRTGYYNEPQYGSNQAPPYALYRRPSSAGPENRYRRESRNDSAYDNNYNGSYNDNHNGHGHSERGRHHEHKHHHKSHRHSRSRSRSSSAGLTDRFDTSGRGVGSATIGAIAGGLIGNEVGKGLLPAVAGAVLGGLGANVWEKNHQKHKGERERERGESRPGKYDRGYSSDGDYEREEKAERRRRRRREREEREGRD